MSTPFHVLIIGEPDTDLSSIRKHLCKRWPALNLVLVDSAGVLQADLIEQSWNCVLYDLCSGSGDEAPGALDQIRKSTPRLPFIIISDLVNFESAIGLLKSGADDFIRKDNLERLVPSIEKAIAGAEASYLRSKAVVQYQEGEHGLGQAQWHALIDTLPDLVWLKDRQGLYLPRRSGDQKFSFFRRSRTPR